jgi:RecB family exonuclease
MSLRPKSLSSSCIDTYLQCLMKFWYKYHTKEKELGDTTALRFGTTVHTAMEVLAKKLMTGVALDSALCESIANNELIAAATAQRIADPNMIKEAQEMVRARVNRHNPTYPIVAAELSFYKLGITTKRGVPLNGIIDLVQEMSPQVALIVDYKTSRMAKSPAEAKTDVQLSMYDLLMSKAYPQYQKTWLVLDFLRSEAVISDRTAEEREAYENWLDQLWITMGDQKPKDVVATINKYCPWCGYKHLCEAFKGVLEQDVKLTPVQSLTSNAEFTAEWTKAKALEKIAKERVAELKAWANNTVELEGVFKFEDDDSTVSWNQSSRTYYDLSMLLPHIPVQDLVRLASLKKEALLTYVNDERPDLKPLLDRAARIAPSGPRMTTKKK